MILYVVIEFFNMKLIINIEYLDKKKFILCYFEVQLEVLNNFLLTSLKV